MQISLAPKFDLFGPRFKAEAYNVYARMRADVPVYRRVNNAGSAATCFITRYDDALAILRDHKRFVKDAHNTMTPAEQAALPNEPPMLSLLSRHMLNADVPHHTRLRGLVNKAFTTRMVEQMQGQIESVALKLLAAIEGDGEADLIESYAFPLPIIVIA